MASKSINDGLLTRIDYREINYSWRIENFSMCGKKLKDRLESERFPNSDEECQWRLRFYPYGIDDESQNFTILYLDFIPKERKSVEVKLNVNYSTPDFTMPKGKERNFSLRYFSEDSKVWCRRTKRDIVLPILENDVLDINCILKIKTNVISTPNKKIKLEEHKLQNQLINNLNEMKDNGSFSDVSLSTKDGTEFPAHKCILAARSPVFSAMFRHDMRESQESTIKIEDIDADTLKHLLHFIYTSKVDEVNWEMEDLLAAADKYAIEDLKEVCEHKLVEKLKVENVIDYLIVADGYGAKILKEQSIKFVNAHLKDVIKTEGMKSLSTTRPSLFYDIMKAQSE